MIRFYCDRCGKELGPGDHVKVEVNRKRRDSCAGPCRDEFEKLRLAEKELSALSLGELRRKMDDLEERFFKGEPVGSEKEGLEGPTEEPADA